MVDLEVGKPALIINVEQSRNSHMIGKCVVPLQLLSVEESIDYFEEPDIKEPYAVIKIGLEGAIQQRFLMPIPPLDDHTYSEDVSVNNNKEVHA